jgi:hypothetical protein
MTGPLPWCGTWDVSAMALFDFCTEQDEDGLPLFEDADKVVFADGTPRPGELDWKNEWNETNAELLSRTEVIRYWKQAAQFLESGSYGVLIQLLLSRLFHYHCKK